jgi:hypothetical protein
MKTDKLTLVRIAKNQATFRAANENINRAGARVGLESDVPFICECADETCIEIVRLSLEEYGGIREHPRHFFNAPGHERLSLDAGASVVVEDRDGYVLVEKTGIAGELVEREA